MRERALETGPFRSGRWCAALTEAWGAGMPLLSDDDVRRASAFCMRPPRPSARPHRRRAGITQAWPADPTLDRDRPASGGRLRRELGRRLRRHRRRPHVGSARAYRRPRTVSCTHATHCTLLRPGWSASCRFPTARSERRRRRDEVRPRVLRDGPPGDRRPDRPSSYTRRRRSGAEVRSAARSTRSAFSVTSSFGPEPQSTASTLLPFEPGAFHQRPPGRQRPSGRRSSSSRSRPSAARGSLASPIRASTTRAWRKS